MKKLLDCQIKRSKILSIEEEDYIKPGKYKTELCEENCQNLIFQYLVLIQKLIDLSIKIEVDDLFLDLENNTCDFKCKRLKMRIHILRQKLPQERKRKRKTTNEDEEEKEKKD